MKITELADLGGLVGFFISIIALFFPDINEIFRLKNIKKAIQAELKNIYNILVIINCTKDFENKETGEKIPAYQTKFHRVSIAAIYEKPVWEEYSKELSINDNNAYQKFKKLYNYITNIEKHIKIANGKGSTASFAIVVLIPGDIKDFVDEYEGERNKKERK